MEANGKICCVRPAPSSRGEQHDISTNFPAIRTHQKKRKWKKTVPPNISIMAGFRAVALLPCLALQFGLSGAAAQRAVVQDSGAVAFIQNKSAMRRSRAQSLRQVLWNGRSGQRCAAAINDKAIRAIADFHRVG